jgi:three-Cys-motif partner protein
MPKSFICLDNDCPNRDSNDYNCTYPSEKDGQAVQCVDRWAEDKFYYFDNYLNATRYARGKYAQYGNAVYVDLYAGPGKCRIKIKQNEISGGALRASSLKEAPFNRLILNDLSINNYNALSKRMGKAEIHSSDANVIVKTITDNLFEAKYDKYHFAFLDPFSPSNLKFDTIRELSRLKRIDIMINFPIGPIRRTYKKWLSKGNEILDEFLGTDEWRKIVAKSHEATFCNTLVDIYYRQLINVGFPEKGLGVIDEQGNDYLGASIASVKNSRNVILYYLILASKHDLAANIWKSILKTRAGGQRGLF